LAANPTQWKALSMAATDALERGDVNAAIEGWERALAAVPEGSDRAASIRSSLEQARQSLTASANNETGGNRNAIR
jgi:cytochrome c-type biogenesis protein CcmH/NrfG